MSIPSVAMDHKWPVRDALKEGPRILCERMKSDAVDGDYYELPLTLILLGHREGLLKRRGMLNLHRAQ